MPAPKKLRISTRFKEIFSVIQASKEGAENLLWKIVKDKRTLYPIQISKIESNLNRIEVLLNSETKDISVGEVIYFKLDSRESAFKTEVVECTSKRVTLAFPDEIILSENRTQIRHYFHPSDEKFIQVRPTKTEDLDADKKPINVLLCDISEQGLGLFVSKSHENQFPLKGKLKLEILGEHKIEKPILGQIVFRVPFEVKGVLAKEPGFKLGVQLDAAIPKNVLEGFLVKKELFHIADEQIVRDEVFRKKVAASVTGIRKSLSAKKGFKALFDALERSDSESDYLKQHIHMLCQVLTGVGSKLGWVTETTLDKLIYVAYLHDVRFATCPKVAKIQTKKEFESMKETLTEEEQKAFLEAPEYASHLASQDSDEYPDAIKILIQQKELPDRSGYPNAIMGSHLAPLSCLFIASHYFVDYVISHPDWTTDDFIKTYQKKLKGQYFTKIFQAMRGN